MENTTVNVSVGFWKNTDDNLRTSVQGLNQAQIDLLHSLKVGDRLVIFNNSFKEKASQPDMNLKVQKPF